ncbi:uncharacterized protein LOC120562995 isoform X3 [Perca fluviatilis]|nr:uncharacterized protein LOC120562995 isoform X2 [Perca fluviatilis]XP_039662930.1 uncharacterized protein LOC120562995 isoform X3 [Perca fluviatilis]
MKQLPATALLCCCLFRLKMTHPTDISCPPLPKSGQSQHTQESGDAGLSSNMKHMFSDHYDEHALPVADEGIFGKPTPNEEVDIVTAMKAKIWSHPNDAGPKAEGHPLSGEGVFPKPSTLNNFPPHTLSKNSPQEETVLPRTTAITEGNQDTEVEGEESCKMDIRKTPEPKGPPLVPGKGRNHRRKRASVHSWRMYFLCWWSFVYVPVSDGFSGAQLAADHKVKCFTCMNEDRCLVKLMTIYDSKHDHVLYKRDLNQTFPGCSVISPTGPKSCDVCIHQFKIIILCAEDVGKLDLDDSDGQQILNISSVCDLNQTLDHTSDGLIVSGGDQTPAHARYGLIVSGALFFTVVAMLVVYSLWQKKRTESGQQ